MYAKDALNQSEAPHPRQHRASQPPVYPIYWAN